MDTTKTVDAIETNETIKPVEPMETVYIDRVKHMFSNLSDVYEELSWFLHNFHVLPEMIVLEDFDVIQEEKREYPHNLHVYVPDAVYHFQHFRSGYTGGSVRAFKNLLMHLSLDLTDDFLSQYDRFELDLVNWCIRTDRTGVDEGEYQLAQKVSLPSHFEVVIPIEVSVGYEMLQKLLLAERDGKMERREVLEKAIHANLDNFKQKGSERGA